MACLMGLVLGPGFLKAGVLMLLIGPRNLHCDAEPDSIRTDSVSDGP